MNVLPVIVRELRAEARHAFTYWLRVCGAGAVVVAAVLFVLTHGFRADQGGALFSQLNWTLQIAIWVLVPLLTADCISRERRDGTLGLLFLTPLTARDIVVAKSLTHGLRAVTLLLAVLPVVTLPLLMGGVSWQQAVISFSLNGAAVCFALAAGLLASAFCKSWVRSLAVVGVLVALFAVAFVCLFGWGLGVALSSGKNPRPAECYELAFSLLFNPGGMHWLDALPRTAGVAAAIINSISATAILMVPAALLFLLLAVLTAARATARCWQEPPPHPLQVWIQQRLCTPVMMLGLLKRWMKRNLDLNPIGWLEQRTWSGRLVIWGWLAVMISLYTLLLTDANYFTRNLGAVHRGMGWMLLASMALNASTSFRRERELGVLELLLVSPLSESQIILGRLRGLWAQFLPSVVLLLGGWTYLARAMNRTADYGDICYFAVGFAAVPVIGLYFSLVCRNFLTGFISTALVGVILPALAAVFLHYLFQATPRPGYGDFSTANLVVMQAGIAVMLGTKLHQRLIHRRFAT